MVSYCYFLSFCFEHGLGQRHYLFSIIVRHNYNILVCNLDLYYLSHVIVVELVVVEYVLGCKTASYFSYFEFVVDSASLVNYIMNLYLYSNSKFLYYFDFRSNLVLYFELNCCLSWADSIASLHCFLIQID